MELTRQEYAAVLDALPPTESAAAFNVRTRQIARLPAELADWLRERGRIEDTYAASLQKLSSKKHIDDLGDFGSFTEAWKNVLAATANLANVHSSVARSIGDEIEPKLRKFASSDDDLSLLPTVGINLSGMARDIEMANRKTATARDRSKAAKSSADLEHATSQWDSQAPFAFERLQIVDERRWDVVRSSLVMLQTYDNDVAIGRQQTAQQCMDTLLQSAVDDEIKTWPIRAVQHRHLRTDSINTVSVPDPSTSMASLPNSTTRPDEETISTSQRPSSSTVEPTTPHSSGRFNALKRLGTVLSRKKTVQTSPTRPPPVPNAHHRISMFPFAKRAGTSHEKSSSARPDDSLPTPQPSSDAEPASSGVDLPFGPPPPQPVATKADADPAANTDATTEADVHTDVEGNADASNTNGVGDDLLATPITGTSRFDLKIRDKPISEEEPISDQVVQDARKSLFVAMGSPSLNPPSVRGRRALQATPISAARALAREPDVAASPDQPAQFDARAQHVQPEVSVQKTPSDEAIQPIQLDRPVQKARENSGADLFIPSPPTGIHQSPPPPPPPRSHGPRLSEPLTRNDVLAESDTRSIRSGSSLSSSITGPVLQSLELTQAGWHGSISEKVDVRQHGADRKASVAGDVGLVFNGPGPRASVSSDSSTAEIEISNYDAIDKMASNPKVVTADPQARNRYVVDAGRVSKPAVLFKYQRSSLSGEQIDDHVPLSVEAETKFDDNTTFLSAVIGPNKAFSYDRAGIELTNVAVRVYFDDGGDGSAITDCRLKPYSGRFVRGSNVVYWILDTVTIDPVNQSPTSLLLRVSSAEKTAPPPRPARIEVSWTTSSPLSGTAVGLRILDRPSGNSYAHGGTGPRFGSASLAPVDPFADDAERSRSRSRSRNESPSGSDQGWTDVPISRRVLGRLVVELDQRPPGPGPATSAVAGTDRAVDDVGVPSTSVRDASPDRLVNPASSQNTVAHEPSPADLVTNAVVAVPHATLDAIPHPGPVANEPTSSIPSVLTSTTGDAVNRYQNEPSREARKTDDADDDDDDDDDVDDVIVRDLSHLGAKIEKSTNPSMDGPVDAGVRVGPDRDVSIGADVDATEMNTTTATATATTRESPRIASMPGSFE